MIQVKLLGVSILFTERNFTCLNSTVFELSLNKIWILTFNSLPLSYYLLFTEMGPLQFVHPLNITHKTKFLCPRCLVQVSHPPQNPNFRHFVRFQVLTAASMKLRIVFWDVLPCKIIVDDRYFTRQYIPEYNSEFRHFVPIEATALKYVASRSSWTAWPRCQI
jgi:hypothetical protein